MKFTKSAGLVFWVLALTYGYFYQDPGSNGNTRLALTMAIVKEKQLSINTFQDPAGGYNGSDVADFNGKYYTDKPIGSSVLGAAVYYPIFKILRLFGRELTVPEEKHLLTFLIIGLPSAAAGTLVYILCEYLSKSRFRAWIVTLAIALGTMGFPFSIVYFGHQLAASLLFGAFFLTFWIQTLSAPSQVQGRTGPFNPPPDPRPRGGGGLFRGVLGAEQRPKHPETSSPLPSGGAGGGRFWPLSALELRGGRVHTFLIGLLSGLAFITDMTTAVIILPMILYYLYGLWTRRQLRQLREWGFPTLGGLIPLALTVAYNLAVYHTPVASGYQYLVEERFRIGMASGIMGIGLPRLDVLFYETLHPAMGILWQSPVLVMALAGGAWMLRKRQYRAELAVAGFACAAYLLLNSGYYMWWGGWSFGVRLVVPMLPFLCLPLIFVPKKFFPIVTILSAVSVIQMLIVAASQVVIPEDPLLRISQYQFFEYSTIYSTCLAQLLQGKFAWNIGQDWLGLPQWSSLLPICGVLVGATILFNHRGTEDTEKTF